MSGRPISLPLEPVVVVVQDEVRREHGLKGSLDAKVKGTTLPAIEVSLSWNNASTVTTTSTTKIVPGCYPELPDQDPTPAVPYPLTPGPPGRAVQAAVPPAAVVATVPVTTVSSGKVASTSSSQSGATPTLAGATTSSRSLGPRPDSGLGTSDSETAAYQTCIETSESSDDDSSDSDVEIFPSAPTADEPSDDEPSSGTAPAAVVVQAGPLLQADRDQRDQVPPPQAAPLPVPAVSTLQVPAGQATAMQVPAAAHSLVAPQGATAGGHASVPRQAVVGQSGRVRGQVRHARARRQRRVRKREWEESEEELSPVDEEASFPSRISPRNKKPYQGYTNF